MNSSKRIRLTKIEGEQSETIYDIVATEEPLEISLAYGTENGRQTRRVSVTMRTPGFDEELAVGFLFTEGIISGKQQIQKVHSRAENTICVELIDNLELNLSALDRNFYTTSSCGVCGKSSIDSIRIVSPQNKNLQDFTLQQDFFFSLPEKLRAVQDVFRTTGGLHASALIGKDGHVILMREDVGRHNALDKLIGACLLQSYALSDCTLLLSGRASFELIQKAAMAGIAIVAAIGAPSSLAVELAEEFGITLVGFLKNGRFNIYTGQERIKMTNFGQ